MKPFAFRVALGLTSLMAALTGGCSTAAECSPPVAQGTRYKATLLAEAPTSDGCHIINGARMSPFEITAGRPIVAGTTQECSTSPAAAPPIQNSIKIFDSTCIPAEQDMLGIYCNIEYPAACQGSVNFHFAAANNRPLHSVDWSAPVIEGIEFVIKDTNAGCFSGNSDCRDVYLARLERLN